MLTHYDFGLRFRQADEDEGSGSLVFGVDGVAANLTNLCRRTITKVARDHPTVVFDGLIMYGARDA
jgi:hypothetical protein